jgi:hypothetical protein
VSTPDYGPFGGIVGSAGALVAATGAIALTWRGRTNWQPSETDLPLGPERVGGVVTAVLVGLLWIVTRPADSRAFVPGLAVAMATLLIVALLVYSILIATQTYVIEIRSTEDQDATEKIIGGFWMKQAVSDALKRDPAETVQGYLKATGFHVDQVWSRTSRALAKATFVAMYLVIVIAGSLALTSVAILVDAIVRPAG